MTQITKSGGYDLKCPACSAKATFKSDYMGHLGTITCTACDHTARSCKFQDKKLKGRN